MSERTDAVLYAQRPGFYPGAITILEKCVDVGPVSRAVSRLDQWVQFVDCSYSTSINLRTSCVGSMSLIGRHAIWELSPVDFDSHHVMT